MGPRKKTKVMDSTDELVQKLDSRINQDSGAIQDFFVQMLKINAVNPRMGGPGEAERAAFLEGFLKNEGFSVERVDVNDAGTGKTRPNLSVKLQGKEPRNLWFLAHMDTVPEGSRELWKTDPFEPVVKEGKIFARGAEDNGQSLVSSLFALVELKRLGVPLPFNVGLWLVADEEFGSDYGVKHLLGHGYFRKEDLVVVPDSGTPDGADIEIAEKGLLWFKVTTIGKQVHASLPSKGMNAHRIGIRLAADLDEELHHTYAEEDALFGERRSTFEPTMVEPNVANVNTIPGVDVFYFDCRVLPRYSLEDVISDIEAKIRAYEKETGASIRLDIVQKDSAGPATSDKSEVSALLAKAVQRAAGKQPGFVGIGGLTVGNLFRKEGIPTAVWSTIDEVAHQPNEYCHIKNLISDAKVFALLPNLA
jgi:succinyl-diaminopimelate desuccinylase